jgi:hypothetical protein
MIPMSILKGIPYVLSTAFGKIERHAGPTVRCLPMYDVHTGKRIRWGIDSDSYVMAPEQLDEAKFSSSTAEKRPSSTGLPVIS